MSLSIFAHVCMHAVLIACLLVIGNIACSYFVVMHPQRQAGS